MKRFDSKAARYSMHEANRITDAKRSKDSDEYKKRVKRLSNSMKKDLMSNVFCEIEKWSSKGHGYCNFGICSYGGEDDDAKLRAYRNIMKELENRGFNVTENISESYSGEGFNMSDFYTGYRWVVDWDDKIRHYENESDGNG